MDNRMICLAVTFIIKEGHEEEAKDLFLKLTLLTRKEPGNLMYVAHCSITDPRRFFLYEQYVDQAALDTHRASEHFIQYGTNGIFKLMESREPHLYYPLQ